MFATLEGQGNSVSDLLRHTEYTQLIACITWFCSFSELQACLFEEIHGARQQYHQDMGTHRLSTPVGFLHDNVSKRGVCWRHSVAACAATALPRIAHKRWLSLGHATMQGDKKQCKSSVRGTPGRKEQDDTFLGCPGDSRLER